MKRTIEITEEMQKLIAGKLEKKNISVSQASRALGWSVSKMNSIIRGYVSRLSVEETEQLICYLPIFKTDLSSEFWYRFNNEKQKAALAWSKEKKKELESKKAAEVKEEPKSLGKSLDEVIAQNEPKEAPVETTPKVEEVKEKPAVQEPAVQEPTEELNEKNVKLLSRIGIAKLLTLDLLEFATEDSKSHLQVILSMLDKVAEAI